MGVRYSAPVHTGPGARPASCTMGTGSFAGLKRPEGGVDHAPPSSADVKERPLPLRFYRVEFGSECGSRLCGRPVAAVESK